MTSVQGARKAHFRAAHEAILRAAAEVLAEKPWASIQEISVKAGIHRSTVYRHFPSREDLLLELQCNYLDAAADEMERYVQVRAMDRDRFSESTRALSEVTAAWRPHAYAPLFQTESAAGSSRERFRAATHAVIRAAHEAAGLRGDLDLEDLRLAWTAPLIYASDKSIESKRVSGLMLAAVLA